LLSPQNTNKLNKYINTDMPKMKTNSSAKKRFKLTGTGKITRKNAFKSHILTKMSTKRKRNLTHTSLVSDADMGNVKRMLCIGK
jgi:large subunit ribosomal protein L35